MVVVAQVDGVVCWLGVKPHSDMWFSCIGATAGAVFLLYFLFCFYCMKIRILMFLALVMISDLVKKIYEKIEEVETVKCYRWRVVEWVLLGVQGYR